MLFNSPIPKSNTFKVIGLMSGTSLDGLDICFCTFNHSSEGWKYNIDKATTIRYSDEIKNKLSSAFFATGIEITKLDYEYGRWIGKEVKAFIDRLETKPDFIASHGHTIYHSPKEGFTLQIGKGSAIAAETGLPCICDFRSSDVNRSGQGAPLVPIGDKHLFSKFDICLNLGGFSNLSFEKDNTRLAYDIGPCNIILNHLAEKLGLSFDNDGQIGQKGKIDSELLNRLNSLEHYKRVTPKSLGREWLEEFFIPIIENTKLNIEDKLATIYEHISDQIAICTNSIGGKTILATGGGAHNSYLIHLLRNKSNHSIVIPDNQTVDYKEALIFAFLGVLYLINEHGALASVTGATSDSISGCLYQ